MGNQLSPEDQARVDQYLSAAQHQVPRKPFKPWLLLGLVLLCVVGLGLLSRGLAQLAY